MFVSLKAVLKKDESMVGQTHAHIQAPTRSATVPRDLSMPDHDSCNIVVEMFDCYVFLTV